MISNFDDATRVHALGNQRFTAEVPDGWQHGKGAFGGVAMAIAVRAMAEVEQERTPTLISAELPGPLLLGPAEIQVENLRSGGNIRVLEARVLQDGETKVRVSMHFAREAAPLAVRWPEPPRLGAWEEVAVLTKTTYVPPFARFFEYRLVGPAPFCGAEEATLEGWIRPREPLERWGPAELIAMSDAYWPSYFSVATAPRLAATVAYTLQLTDAAHTLDPAIPLFSRSRTLVADSAQLLEMRELWTSSGDLVAMSAQTLRVIR